MIRFALLFAIACRGSEPTPATAPRDEPPREPPARWLPATPSPRPHRDVVSSHGGDGRWTLPLTREQLVAGMAPVKPRVQRCYEQHRVPGLANVALTIHPDGTVSDVKTSGPFTSTPTGACVDEAVRAARFPAFTGAPFTINYPFMLR